MPKVNYYHPDDVQVRVKRTQNKNTRAKLRSAITPGTVLILLAGRFKGRRVVCLKQLESGLLLITGPYKVNGVPLRRVNQAYVQPTSTKLDVSGVKVDDVDDAFFARKRASRDISRNVPFASLDQEEGDMDRLMQKKKRQVEVDKALLNQVAKVPMMKKYLATRFSLRSGMYPHDMNF